MLEPTFFFVLALTLSIVSIIGMFLLILRRNHPPVKRRGWEIVIISKFFYFFDSWTYAVYGQSFGPYYFCRLGYWETNVFVVSVVYPNVIRTIVVYLQYKWNQEKMSEKKSPLFKYYPFLTSVRFTVGLYALIMAFEVMIILIVEFMPNSPIPEMGENVPVCVADSAYNVVFQIVVGVILCIMCLFLLYFCKDGYYMRLELCIFLCCFIVIALFWGLDTAAVVPVTALPITASIGYHIAITSSSIAPPLNSFSKYWKLHDDAVSTHSMESQQTITLGICLDTPELFVAFKQFCIELWCAENLMFYIEAKAFQEDENETTMTDRAQRLARDYVRFGSPMEINISEVTRKNCITKIDGQDISRNIFHDASTEVYRQMKQDTFHKFVQTKVYEQVVASLGRERASSSLEKSEAAVQLLKLPQ